MRTAIRRPRARKPVKGQRQFLKQNAAAIVLTDIAKFLKKKKQWFYTKMQMRSFWLRSHSRSKYKPHQGAQEKARRVRQMAAGTHGYPQQARGAS